MWVPSTSITIFPRVANIQAQAALGCAVAAFLRSVNGRGVIRFTCPSTSVASRALGTARATSAVNTDSVRNIRLCLALLFLQMDLRRVYGR